MADFRAKLTEDRLSEILRESECGESTAPGSTLSVYTNGDRDTESEEYSSSLPTMSLSQSQAWNFLDEDGHSQDDAIKCEKSTGFFLGQCKDTAFSADSYFPKQYISLFDDRFSPEKHNQDMSYFSVKTEAFPSGHSSSFLPINSVLRQGQSPRAPSPGINKMMLSLVDHPQERPCTPTASTLYKNTVTHCNPSWLGQCTFEECVEFTQWINDFLKYGRLATRVSDLARDLGDGITLLDLAEVLVGTHPPQVHVKPALAVQKLENIHVCLQFLARNDVAIQEVTAEDIVQGNLKVVLALCHCLRRHFGSASGPVLLIKNPHSGQWQNSHPTTKSYQPVMPNVCFDSDSPGLLSDSAALNKGDVAILAWAGSVIRKELVNFKALQSGTVLCLLLNKIDEGSIPDVVIKYGLPSEKISLALQVSRKDFGVLSNLSTDDVLKGHSIRKLSNYLRSLQQQFFRRHAQREPRNSTTEQRTDQQSTYFDLSVDKDPTLGSSLFGNEDLSAVVPSMKSSQPTLSRSKEKLAQLNRELKLLKMAISDETYSALSQKDGFERDATDSLGESSYFSNLSFESEYSKPRDPVVSKNEHPTSFYTCGNRTFDGISSPLSPYASLGNVKSRFYPNSTFPPPSVRPNISRSIKDVINREPRTRVPAEPGGLTYNPSSARANAKLDFTPKPRTFATDKKVSKELNALKRASDRSPENRGKVEYSTPAGSRHFDVGPDHGNRSMPQTSRIQAEQTSFPKTSSPLHTMTAFARLSSKKASAVS